MRDRYYQQPVPVQIRFSARNIIGVIAALAAMDLAVKIASRNLDKLNKRLDRAWKTKVTVDEE